MAEQAAIRLGRTICRTAACLALLVSAPALAAHSGGYRGPQNNGIYPATGLLKAWPAGGPRLRWKTEVGEGFAGVAVVDDTVYTAGGGSGVLYAFSLDGDPRYKIPFGDCSWNAS